jgi:hypothetical protein
MSLFDFRKILRYLGEKGWELMIIAFFFLFALLVLSNLHFFQIISEESSKPVSEEIDFPAVKRDLLQKVLGNIAEKEKRFNESLLTKPDIADPS